jgi:hypothetical protein
VTRRRLSTRTSTREQHSHTANHATTFTAHAQTRIQQSFTQPSIKQSIDLLPNTRLTSRAPVWSLARASSLAVETIHANARFFDNAIPDTKLKTAIYSFSLHLKELITTEPDRRPQTDTGRLFLLFKMKIQFQIFLLIAYTQTVAGLRDPAPRKISSLILKQCNK